MKRLEDRKERRRLNRLYKKVKVWNNRAGAARYESARDYNKPFRDLLGF